MKGQAGMTLRTRLVWVAGITLLAFILLGGLLLSHFKDEMLSSRKDKVRNLAEAAQTIVAHFEQQSRDGKMDQPAAQAAALQALRAIRYDKKEYFWVNDLSPKMLMHPMKPELEGKDLSQLKDPNGKALFLEMVQVVKNAGAGFVSYQWSKPGSTEPVDKISYVQGFSPWGWVIGTGIYIDDVEAKFRSALWVILPLGLLMMGMVGASLLLLGRSLFKLLGGEPHEAVALARSVARGHLDQVVTCKAGDKDSLMASLRDMQQTLRTMIAEVISGAGQMSVAASGLSQSAAEVARRSNEQSGSASSIAAAVEEMSVSIDHVTANTSDARGLAENAREMSGRGAVVIHRATSEVHKIAELVKGSAVSIEELGRQSDKITSIVGTIKDIADQTNLLALNAAIEAARAGEQGRGFAVVADEVRKLAERTSQSTVEIAAMVGQIQTGTREAIVQMENGVQQANASVLLANEAGTAIEDIRLGAEQVRSVVDNISSAIREQSMATTEIAKAVEQIAQRAEAEALETQLSARSAQDLQNLSTHLHQSVQRFKL
ncbi:methyl-accepting chemotaxis protein [Iodobacter fluviatilis]|uniref:Methyl-accepting chemotaxis protein 4 n=1 Tax=Iodobacter fluviatilis TaxID=537 RepID=A0A377Q4E7_9NEIS|nr:cache domain-containing protein [Iodobacter fluviatilis]TCU82701.1 methyl-accepting chemotaxis sensory transducer with Cache sensor [Iodobacter fluviatilis]STQ89813.1 Methyl-accepting chemotaxis protein 4 [Iodobacter fluviatilis]